MDGKRIKEIDRTIWYCQRLKAYLLEEINDDDSIDSKIYKKYLQLESLMKVNAWLRENNYRYLDEVNFQPHFVREVIEKRNPNINQDLNDVVKIYYYDDYDWKSNIDEQKIWWLNWERLNNGYKRDKVIRELEHILRLRYKKSIHNKVSDMLSELHVLIDDRKTKDAAEYVEHVFKDFLKDELENK